MASVPGEGIISARGISIIIQTINQIFTPESVPINNFNLPRMPSKVGIVSRLLLEFCAMWRKDKNRRSFGSVTAKNSMESIYGRVFLLSYE